MLAVVEASDRERLPAACGAYLESFDRLLRARTDEDLLAADEGMGRSMDLIGEITDITPRRMPRKSGLEGLAGWH